MAAPPITLRAVIPPPDGSPGPSAEPGPAPSKVTPPPSAPPDQTAKTFPTDEELDGLTPEEFTQALEAARALKKQSKQAASA